MPRFVALFRGINVGRAKRVAMADLRALMAALGYTDIVTVLNSGNAVFTAPTGAAVRHAQRIQATVATTLGIDAKVVVVPAADFSAAVADNPLRTVAKDPSHLLVAFTQEPAALAELAALTASDWAPDALAVGKRAAYLWCAEGVLASKLAQAVNRQLGERVTTRNWATVQKIAALLDPVPAQPVFKGRLQVGA